MKYKPSRLAAIFFMTIFYSRRGGGGGMAHRPSLFIAKITPNRGGERDGEVDCVI